MKDSVTNIESQITGFVDQLVGHRDVSGDAQVIEPGMAVFSAQNTSDERRSAMLSVNSKLILYFFPEKGDINITATIGEEKVYVDDRSYVMCAFPFEDWRVNIEMPPNGMIRGLAFTLSKLHELFGNLSLNDPEVLKEAISNYRIKSFYSKKDYHARVQLVIHQLSESEDAGIASVIYRRGKVMEFLSMFIDPDVALPDDKDGCPYISNNLDLEKIRNAERILVTSLEDPPTIRELAKEVGTNELKLKTGFKHVYGNTIYAYLTDQRMETARLLLEKHRMQIKDVAGRVGYTNPSHFIAAFRKKYGVTPKKYLLSL